MARLLRMLRRGTTLEHDNELFYQTEFCNGGKPDLAVSVYEVAQGEELMVQIKAEHSAAAHLKPRRAWAIDVGPIFAGAPVKSGLAHKYFRFADQAHRELPFADERDARAFAGALFTSLRAACLETSKPTIHAYVHKRLTSKDSEWHNYCTASPVGPHWLKFLRPP